MIVIKFENMKKLMIIVFFLSLYSGYAQTIQQAGVVPLEDYHLYNAEDPSLKINDGLYFKDVNNHLNKFAGSWQGEYEDKTLILEVSILENVESLAIYFDELLIKYKITDVNGNEVVNTIQYFDDYKYHISGNYFPDNTAYYIASYVGYEYMCNQKGRAIMHIVNSNTMTFWILPDNDMIGPECPMGNIHILPTTLETLVTLAKQN
jgi:hypothetical protein